MSDGIWAALSGAVAQERSLEIVANNVANAGTTGFRGDRVAFQEALGNARGAGGATPPALRFVAISRVRSDEAAGPLRQTGAPLDLALQGRGYFAVATPAGERYTRAGSFVAGPNGQLQTADGHPVVAAGGPDARFSIPAGARELAVAADGTVLADGQEVGKIALVRFDSADQLTREGRALYSAVGTPPQPDPETTVAQGYLGGANVNAVAGVQELITVSRSFEAFQKVIQSFRELDQRTAREVSGR
jgi:flagellar basal-body rod protein FlgF